MKHNLLKMRFILMLFILSMMTACQPDTVTVEILAYNASNDRYQFTNVEISTLDDVHKLSGEATSIIAGAEVELNFLDDYIEWKNPGRYPSFSAIKDDGVLIPEDFDSLAMISAYYNMEKSMLFFYNLGMTENTLSPLDTYYWPELDIVPVSGETTTQTDNAFYLYVTDEQQGFYLFPFDIYQWLPMTMNTGIIAHEYTHAVFDAVILNRYRDAYMEMADPGYNFLAGLNEGLADFMAVSLTKDSNFMSHSISDDLLTRCNSSNPTSIVRNAAIQLDYSDDIDLDARFFTKDVFCPYDIGAFVASLFYEIAFKLNQSAGHPTAAALDSVSKLLYLSMKQLGSEYRENFELWQFFNIYITAISSNEEKQIACSTLFARYAMHYSEITACDF